MTNYVRNNYNLFNKTQLQQQQQQQQQHQRNMNNQYIKEQNIISFNNMNQNKLNADNNNKQKLYQQNFNNYQGLGYQRRWVTNAIRFQILQGSAAH